MLKTNTKKVRSNIRAFIQSIFDASGYDKENLNNASFEDQAEFIAKTYFDEHGKYLRVGENIQNDFIEWLQGLPSVIDSSSYYLHNAKDILGDILEETEQEKAKYTESEAEELLSRLIFRELSHYIFDEIY